MSDGADQYNRYRAVMLLHALGDTIGFKNGDWEFNYNEKDKLNVLDYVNEMIYEFIDLGGVNGIDLKNWKVSDDTMFHIATARSMLEYKGRADSKFFNIMKMNLYDEADKIWKEVEKKTFNRYIGVTTSDSIGKFTETFDARNDPYEDFAGGNGGAMRTLVIGMTMFGEKHREQMIELSTISTQLTHNNALGYLAGFNSALFVALAFEQQPIKKWPYILLHYLKSEKLKSYLSLKNLDQIYDHQQYVRFWQKYIDTRFDRNKEPIRTRSTTNPMYRIRYYHDNFFKGTPAHQIGDSGYLCMIMAYDALLDCDGKWEKLIVYSMLHSGDSDTIGAVAGGLYGAVYGFGDVPPNMLRHIERKDELEQLASDLYKKFQQKTD
jgi:ADP-ribosylglycohydrolase